MQVYFVKIFIVTRQGLRKIQNDKKSTRNKNRRTHYFFVSSEPSVLLYLPVIGWTLEKRPSCFLYLPVIARTFEKRPSCFLYLPVIGWTFEKRPSCLFISLL